MSLYSELLLEGDVIVVIANVAVPIGMGWKSKDC